MIAVLMALAVAAAASPAVMLPGFSFGEADYPPAALREGVEGRVGYRVTVDPAGVPHDCTVTDPSSSKALDARTCEIVVARMRFTPAHDARGRPVTGPYEQHIRWKIDADGYTFMSEGTTTLVFTFAPDGSIDRCTTEASGHAANSAAVTCAMLPLEVLPFVFGSPTSELISATMVARFSTGADAIVPDTPVAGEVKIALSAHFTITKAGGTAGCVPSGSVVVINGRIDACQALELATRDRPHPFAPAAERAARVSLTVHVVKRGADGARRVPPPPPR